MLQDAQIDKVAAAAANLDVVFLLNVAPDLSIVPKASEIETLQNRWRIHGQRFEPASTQEGFAFGIDEAPSCSAMNSEVRILIDLVNEFLTVGFDFLRIDFEGRNDVRDRNVDKAPLMKHPSAVVGVSFHRLHQNGVFRILRDVQFCGLRQMLEILPNEFLEIHQ